MSDFYAKILDANDAVQGDGPLDTLTQLNDYKLLDAIGTASFALPAADPRIQYMAAGSQFDLYDRVDGYLGRFPYKSKSLTEQAGLGNLQVECYDQLRELSRLSVNFRRKFSNIDVATVISTLVALVPNWTATSDAGIGNTYVIYEGESVLIAIDVLRDRWNQHYRLGGARELQFGAFGTDSGIRLMNLRGQVQGEFTDTNVVIVEQIRLVEESDEIFNRVIPLGAGQGLIQQTIELATLGSYTVQTGTNADSSSFYYIEDAASVASYGRRVKILSLPQIAPVTNNTADVTNAANALKLSAEAYIARHLVPKIIYDVTVRALRQPLKVGDKVRLCYRGIVDNYCYIDVDEDFYVIGINKQRSADGNRSATLTIASVAVRRTADSDVMLEIVSDLKALKVHIPLNLSNRECGPYVLRMDSTHTADFSVVFGTEVVGLNYAKLRFKTSPLKSSVTTVSDAGSTPATSSDGGSATPTSGDGGSATPTSSNGGAATPTSSDAGSQTPTSSDGGSQTPTSSDGGSQTPTSSDGGSQTPTSGNGGSQTPTSSDEQVHYHQTVIYPTDGTGVLKWYVVSGVQAELHSNAGGSNILVDTTAPTNAHNHTVTIANHNHSVTVAAHNHSVTVAAHNHAVSITNHNHSIVIANHNHTVSVANHTHTVTIANHNHTVTIANHNHSVTVPAHNHTPSYGLYADTHYPYNLSLTIDGVDRTAALGGPWQPADATFTTELDITTYLNTNLQSAHILSFSCTNGQGEIECSVRLLTVIQAIAVA